MWNVNSLLFCGWQGQAKVHMHAHIISTQTAPLKQIWPTLKFKQEILKMIQVCLFFLLEDSRTAELWREAGYDVVRIHL